MPTQHGWLVRGPLLLSGVSSFPDVLPRAFPARTQGPASSLQLRLCHTPAQTLTNEATHLSPRSSSVISPSCLFTPFRPLEVPFPRGPTFRVLHSLHTSAQ